MLLGVMLLYVGAVLIVNGIWLFGQARAATLAPAGDAGPETSAHPTLLQNREVTVLNLFTGFVGIVCAATLLIQGNQKADLASIRGGGFILLFAFTYLWVALNTFLDADGRAFGWYCLFVAVTAVGAAIYTFKDAAGDDANIWLGIDWVAWAVLWLLFFLLLALQRPIARVTGLVAIVEGIATSWVFGFLLLQGSVAFG
jgi:putative amide transporter protein